MKNELYVQLNNGRPVHSAFLDCIRIAVEERIPALQPNVKYTLKKICGKGFWKELDDGDQERAGWCMTHMVAKNQVPMQLVGKDCHHTNVYVLA